MAYFIKVLRGVALTLMFLCSQRPCLIIEVFMEKYMECFNYWLSNMEL